jgi:transcriptional regulator with XRE-family HTH domain
LITLPFENTFKILILAKSITVTYFLDRMSFGKRLTEARKSKGMSQEDIAKMLNTKSPVIGRYEREEMTPSVEVATKLASILEVSLDYLVGNTEMQLDKSIIKRIQQIQSLNKEDKEHLFALMDAFLFKSSVQKQLA